MNQIKIKDDYIRLGQAMKLAGLASSGVEAKILIGDGQVLVNGEVELQRGKKLRNGDIFSFDGQEVQIQA
jgi:ribosome-associated protein